MKRLFTKSFFKFTAGFIGIVAISVLTVLIIGSFEVEQEYQASVDTVIDPVK